MILKLRQTDAARRLQSEFFSDCRKSKQKIRRHLEKFRQIVNIRGGRLALIVQPFGDSALGYSDFLRYIGLIVAVLRHKTARRFAEFRFHSVASHIENYFRIKARLIFI